MPWEIGHQAAATSIANDQRLLAWKYLPCVWIFTAQPTTGATARAIVIAFDQSFDRTASGEDLVLGLDISGMQAALTTARGTRRGLRHYFYAMDTVGNEVVLEFRSEIETRVLATWTNENCSGREEFLPMPLNLSLVPLRLASWRRKRWWEKERGAPPTAVGGRLEEPANVLTCGGDTPVPNRFVSSGASANTPRWVRSHQTLVRRHRCRPDLRPAC